VNHSTTLTIVIKGGRGIVVKGADVFHIVYRSLSALVSIKVRREQPQYFKTLLKIVPGRRDHSSEWGSSEWGWVGRGGRQIYRKHDMHTKICKRLNILYFQI